MIFVDKKAHKIHKNLKPMEITNHTVYSLREWPYIPDYNCMYKDQIDKMKDNMWLS